MSHRRRIVNPLYLLLSIAGAVFVVSALVYGMMTLQLSHAIGDWTENTRVHPLVSLFRDHGNAILLVELSILAILTVAAMWTDEYWTKRAQKRTQSETQEGQSPPASQCAAINKPPTR